MNYKLVTKQLPATTQATEDQPAAAPAPYGRVPRVPWNPWFGIVFLVLAYYFSQFVSGLLLSVFPLIRHWNYRQSTDWLNNSVPAQFIYVLLAESLMIGALYVFLRVYRQRFSVIGFVKPRWRDLGFGLIGALIYYVLYLFIAVPLVTHLLPSLNVDQAQQIGFQHVHGLAQLTLTFISLAILPPLAEEIMVRGFLYSSWRKAVPKLVAITLTSLMFASAHLPEGGAAGPLYIAAVDTFVLSVVLIGLRERTGSLWAGITTHAIKNSVAFMALFIFIGR